MTTQFVRGSPGRPVLAVFLVRISLCIFAIDLNPESWSIALESSPG
jgi:hypothetical protein